MFNTIKISIASPAHIRMWSFGEIKKPDTINYRTAKPEDGGLFCSKIFGPIRDYECDCGKYKKIKHRGTICEKCGVEITVSRVRRERMGHIELACPVVHTWFFRSLPSKICTVLGLSLKKVEKVLCYDNYIVINPGNTSFLYRELISEEEYLKSVSNSDDKKFRALVGAEAIKEMLKNTDLKNEQIKLRSKLLKSTSDDSRKKILKKLELIENFIKSKNKAEWMVIDVLPVIPPDLRPLVMLDIGKFATSDLNELYRKIINRNNRLYRLIELQAPEIIIRNEKRMLQESVDSLFDNSKKNRFMGNSNKRTLKSFTDMLKGKYGRFRQNLLGKRVDYSGRSVIIVGAELSLDQCGIPKRMALELMKPFIYSKLEWYGIAKSVKSAKKIVENYDSEIWDIVDEVVKDHPLLLNRAPTLHRLGMQAFNVILVEGNAIRLHPLVCTAFNADFDGDQMAVHVPLSIESRLESKILMMSINNILNPANGEPIVSLTQDMVLGVYFLSLSLRSVELYHVHFCDIQSIKNYLDNEKISLHTKIIYKMHGSNFIITTPGRFFIYEVLPKEINFSFYRVNKVIVKQEISKIIENSFQKINNVILSSFINTLMKIGFYYSSLSGISIGKDDLLATNKKRYIIGNTFEKIRLLNIQYFNGFLTRGEKYSKIIDEWTKCVDKITIDIVEILKNNIVNSINLTNLNNISVMINSGSRGSSSQIRQLSGIRGLMTKPSGDIINTPIISSFKEGLIEIEYFLSTHGARKGLADTALKTANSGYLTRKLVDVAQDCIVVENDCGSRKFLTINLFNNKVNIEESILGRISASHVEDINKGIILKHGDIIDRIALDKIVKNNVCIIKIRSALTCITRYGICAKCYGSDLSTGAQVNLGEAVGVVAAQSIGEPGTQLTMRTFHIGGSVSQKIYEPKILSPDNGIIRLTNINIISHQSGVRINTSKNCRIHIYRSSSITFIYKIIYGTRIYLTNFYNILSKKKILEWDDFITPIISEIEGYVIFKNFEEGKSFGYMYDNITNTKCLVTMNNINLKPTIIIKNKYDCLEYYIPIGSIIHIKEYQKIRAGDVIIKTLRKSSRGKDITGGLPRVVELLEARHSKNAAILSEIEGIIFYNKNIGCKKKVTVVSECKRYKREYIFAKHRKIMVNEGDYIFQGDILIDGYCSPHDILKIKGFENFVAYMIKEIQNVYKLQGVKINNKHIEIILKQMLKKVKIICPGDTAFVYNEYIDKEIFEKINNDIISNGGIPAKCKPILQGITKSALQTYSFLSAASFQETIRVLTSAAISGKVDYLRGLKENVITGRLVPAGTGFCIRKLQQNEKNI